MIRSGGARSWECCSLGQSWVLLSSYKYLLRNLSLAHRHVISPVELNESPVRRARFQVLAIHEELDGQIDR